MDNYIMIDDECTICFESLSDKKKRNVLCCNKYIHEDCLKIWLKKDKYNRCPCCNQSVDIKFSFFEKMLCLNTRKFIRLNK